MHRLDVPVEDGVPPTTRRPQGVCGLAHRVETGCAEPQDEVGVSSNGEPRLRGRRDSVLRVGRLVQLRVGGIVVDQYPHQRRGTRPGRTGDTTSAGRRGHRLAERLRAVPVRRRIPRDVVPRREPVAPDQAGRLAELVRVSSVSGGSIVAGVLGRGGAASTSTTRASPRTSRHRSSVRSGSLLAARWTCPRC